jgi:hypothetical protein
VWISDAADWYFAGHLHETRTTCCRCGASRKFKTARGAVLELLQSCTHHERKNADALKKFRLACALKPLLLRRVSPYSHLGEPLFEGAT